jgi:RNA polymerase sigma-70 factor (ECF subfamily)
VRNADRWVEQWLESAPRLLLVAQRLSASREDAEDLLHDVFVLAATALESRDHPALEDPYRWLLTVLLNAHRDSARRRARWKTWVGLNWIPCFMKPDPPPETVVLANDLQACVQTALQCLSARQREAVVLCYMGELTQQEAAAAAGISLSRLKTHLRRGLSRLRLLLSEEHLHGLQGP